MLNRDSHVHEISPDRFEPRIVAFFCNWCTYLAADLAGTSRMKYAPNMRVIRLMCSGRVDPQFVLDAFAHGADGVFIGGCHPGDCHYQEGNYKTLRRYRLLRRVLAGNGNRRRTFSSGVDFRGGGGPGAWRLNEMVEKVRALGPLSGGERRREGPHRGGAGLMPGNPKVAFYWCASCGGCEEAVVDLAEAILDVVASSGHCLLARGDGFQAQGRGVHARRLDHGDISERRHSHQGTARDGAVVQKQIASARGPGIVLPTWRHSRSRQFVRSRGHTAEVYVQSPSTMNAEQRLPQTHYQDNGHSVSCRLSTKRCARSIRW